MKNRFLAYWFLLWGDVISKPMCWFDWGFLYPYYHKCMSKSVDFDTEERMWKKSKPNTEGEGI